MWFDNVKNATQGANTWNIHLNFIKYLKMIAAKIVIRIKMQKTTTSMHVRSNNMIYSWMNRVEETYIYDNI